MCEFVDGKTYAKKQQVEPHETPCLRIYWLSMVICTWGFFDLPSMCLYMYIYVYIHMQLHIDVDVIVSRLFCLVTVLPTYNALNTKGNGMFRQLLIRDGLGWQLVSWPLPPTRLLLFSPSFAVLSGEDMTILG